MGPPTWPAATPSGRLRRAGKLFSHVAQHDVQCATARPPPTALRSVVAPRGPPFESTLPARRRRVVGRASPPTKALAARSLCFRTCGQTSVGSPISVPLNRAAPHASLPAKLVAEGSGLFGRVSKRGTRAAPRHSASGRMTAPGASPPTHRLRAMIGSSSAQCYRCNIKAVV